MSAHTPGPWQQRPNSGWVVTESGCVADCRQTNNPARNIANARLIAAAPDLLSALDRIMEYAHIGASACDIDPNEQPQFVAAREAIAKAKGAA